MLAMKKLISFSCDSPSHKITNVCLFEDCDDNLLCSKCVSTHNKFHSREIKKLDDILTSDPEKQIRRFIHFKEKCKNYQKMMNEQYENFVDQIYSELATIFNKSKLSLKEINQLFLEEIERIPENLEELTKDMNTTKNQFIQIKNPTSDHGRSLLNSYIDKYRKFNGHLNKKSQSIKARSMMASLTHKELEEHKLILLNSVEVALNSFKQAYFGENLHRNKHQFALEPSDFMMEKIEVPSFSMSVLDFDITQLKKECSLKLAAPPSWNSIEYIDQHNLIIIGDTLGNLELWNASSPFKCLSIQKQHQSAINTLKYHKKRNCLFTASDDTTIKVLEIQTLPIIDTISTLKDHKDVVWSLLILDDYDMMYSSGKEPYILGWDLVSNKLKHKIDTQGKDTTGTQMALIPRLNLLAVSFLQGVICLYNIDAPNKGEVLSIKTSQKWLHTLTYIESRDELVAGVDDGIVKVWKVGEGGNIQNEKEYKIPGQLPSSISSINEDREILICGRSEKLVSLDLEMGQYKISAISGITNVNNFKIIPTIHTVVMVPFKGTDVALAKY